jgi:hypothetical protein
VKRSRRRFRFVTIKFTEAERDMVYGAVLLVQATEPGAYRPRGAEILEAAKAKLKRGRVATWGPR